MLRVLTRDENQSSGSIHHVLMSGDNTRDLASDWNTDKDIPAYLTRRLQSVLNAAARLVYQLRFSNHITDALVCLHWLRIPERIEYKIALLTYKVMNGMAPRYLGPFVRVADLPAGRRALLSAVTNHLIVPAVKLSTIGSRAFSVSGPQTWNQLPEEITSATSLSTFQRHLKTFLFRKSFADILLIDTLVDIVVT